MPYDEIRCVRCWRTKYKVKIGLVILVLADGTKNMVPVCEPHIKEMQKWLQLSVKGGTSIKLPKTLDDHKQLNLYE